jgi:hypothetical protein
LALSRLRHSKKISDSSFFMNLFSQPTRCEKNQVANIVFVYVIKNC